MRIFVISDQARRLYGQYLDSHTGLNWRIMYSCAHVWPQECIEDCLVGLPLLLGQTPNTYLGLLVGFSRAHVCRGYRFRNVKSLIRR